MSGELPLKDEKATVEDSTNVSPPVSEKPPVELARTGTDDTPSEETNDEIEYPAKWRLALIMIALCLAVFCMALVRARRPVDSCVGQTC